MSDDDNHGSKDEKKKKRKSKHHRGNGEAGDDDGEDEAARKERRRRERERRKKNMEDDSNNNNNNGDDEDERRERRRRKKEKQVNEYEEGGGDLVREKFDDIDKQQKKLKESDRNGDEKYRKSKKPDDDDDAYDVDDDVRQGRTSNKKPVTKFKSKNDNDDEDDASASRLLKPSGNWKASKPADTIKSRSYINLWDVAVERMDSKEKNMTKNEHEKSVVFLGGKSSGKTSIILRFLERPDDQAKPTVGVEYVYARMNKSNSMGKDIGHVWEVGGGVIMSKLIDSVIDSQNISSMGIVLTVDLSQPKRLWTVLEHWLRVLKSRVDDVIKHGGDGKNGRIRERLLEAARMKYQEDHLDLDLLDLFPLPITIVCTKYDTFQNFESEERKVICRTLRFLAHTIGAHLQFCSTMKCEGLVSRVKGLISNLLFNTEIAPSQQTAHNKPLSVTAGQDTMQDIGMPPIPDGDVGKLSARTPMELWKYAYTKYFPQEDIMNPTSSSSSVKDPSKDIQYKEVEIDALKMQKDQELMKYMKALERQDELRSL